MDLGHHGDAEVGPGLVDLAVNVRGPMPAWLRAVVAQSLDGVAAYPSQTVALQAVSAAHDRPAGEVLLTAGAAEAFVLLARLPWQRPVVVHPQFTEPEAALRAAGHDVERVVLAWPYVLDPGLVPDDADLVVVGNPTNPTSVLHPAATLTALLRPGRTLVVDEAFMDTTDERESLTGHPQVVVLRSLTKSWGLAGLRCGYVLGPAPLVTALRERQPLWPVSTPALAAIAACAGRTPDTLTLADDRKVLVAALTDAGLEVVPDAAASYVLVRGPELWEPLRHRGFAARRGDTFPGLGPHFLRVAVREPEVSRAFAAAVADLR